MIVDQKQREDALDCKKSFIMQAPAGAGKTEILIQRILSLLTTVDKPEEILALTFTRKAASEMQHRVIQALTNAHQEAISTHEQTTKELAKKVLQQDNKLNWNIISNPSRLQIATIDSFATGLMHQAPMLTAVGGKMNIADKPGQLYIQAFKKTMAHLETSSKWSQSLANIIRHFDNQLNIVEELLVNMLQKREQWLPYIIQEQQPQDLLTLFNFCLTKINQDNIQQFINTIEKADQNILLQTIKFAANNILDDNELLTIIQQLNTIKEITDSHMQIWDFCLTIILTSQNTLRKSVTKKQGFPAKSAANKQPLQKKLMHYKQLMINFLSKYTHNEDFINAAINLKKSPPSQYPDIQYLIMEDILKILPLTVANLMLVFKEHNVIDFPEVNIRALDSMGTAEQPTDLAMLLDHNINHLLIDEFQDTSINHFRIIQKLTMEWSQTPEKTIFIVGDPMQSIYRFREAEVELFLQVKENGINYLTLIPLLLSSNFRSNSNIVKWCNTVFASSFPKQDNPLVGAVGFNASASTKQDNNNSSVNLHVCEDLNTAGDILVKLIKKKILDQPHQKIAILARARKHLKILIPKLQQNSLNFIANEIDSLLDKTIVTDLLSLTKAINNFADHLSWLSILRSPWIGLNLQDLFIIRQHSQTTYVINTILEIPSMLTDDGKHRLLQIVDVVQFILEHSHKMSLYKLTKQCFKLFTNENVVFSLHEQQIIQQYFMLLTEYEAQAIALDLNEFTTQLHNTRISPDPTEQPNIELMTIHKSKGLEFDTVLLFGMDQQSPMPQRGLLEWLELIPEPDKPLMLIAPINSTGDQSHSIYNYLYYLTKQKEANEKKRLFYVAATRAKNELHIFTNHQATAPPHTSSLIKPFWQQITNITNTFIHNTTILDSAVADISQSPQNYRLIRENNITIITDYSFLEQNKDLASYQILDDTIHKNIGITTHYLLQLIATNGNYLVETTIKDISYRKLIELGTPQSKLNQSLQIIINAIINTQDDPTGKWILNHRHIDSKTEYQISTILQDKVVNVIIDRTFVEDNIRWIIDYKMNIAEANEILSNEVIQKKYQSQLNLYSKIISLQDTRKIMQGIYLPINNSWYTFEYQP